ncbi:MAG: 16S rRNA (guanine(527)-N(7))-methyltransferase RsmG [Oscillospiraceae bacterium]|jgi:16S rRNA (guanine527-N7)-methyltransferase|nr:16S rRNA (guanine(527)-N(7))-methyltransferase RsmG [Oscillospiraceae bacterium]
MNEKLACYAQILLRENATHNLTAITDPEEIRRKHFDDSLALLRLAGARTATEALGEQIAVLDVGAGAGFPGLPLAIARPGWRVALLESTEKKARFLETAARELALPVRVVCARAETAAHNPALREQFDLVVARAVAALPLLCELCLPFVKPGGLFCAYKGTSEKTWAELAQAQRGIARLGGEDAGFLCETTEYGERTLVLCKKISRTPTNYPRNYGTMRKKSL